MVSSGNEIASLLDRYEEIEFSDPATSAGHGISGWQCENPYARALIDAVIAESRSADRVAYAYLEDDERVVDEIRKRHVKADAVEPEAIHVGAGANALLFSFAAYLRSIGISEVYCISPLYFSLQYALRLFKIRIRPISARQTYEEDFEFRLPDKRTILLLTDPIWYAGIAVPKATLDVLRAWQSRTGSTIFVDGSFQYMAWNGSNVERSASLVPGLTFRIVCPTKTLAVHGFRFAYVLLPNLARKHFANAHNTIYGSTNTENLIFARHAMEAIKKGKLTGLLVELLRSRHESYRASGAISSSLNPDRGYFVFERPNPEISFNTPTMDGSYFDQPRYPEYIRLNLLSPALSAFR